MGYVSEHRWRTQILIFVLGNVSKFSAEITYVSVDSPSRTSPSLNV